MLMISAFSHLIDGLIAIHRRNRNTALMNDLSDATRRDIGWPDRYRTPDDDQDGFKVRRTHR
ncbi:hypothetical protein GTW25_07000 [Aliihoeflea aestuarii]|jgi:hypothetical protein|uniref:hypothetical protein n=1 Tax=Aliihoeflea aestuarii TaxID=453840 RepID=UPI00209396D4|nr:hypothetical protein [Aliihoeflea aestuarii]MCO6390774.1 hypothetical protein [Aliihoeflea aestuarii]